MELTTHSDDRVGQLPPILVPPCEQASGLVVSFESVLHESFIFEGRGSWCATSSLEVDAVSAKQIPPLLIEVKAVVAPVEVSGQAELLVSTLATVDRVTGAGNSRR